MRPLDVLRALVVAAIWGINFSVSKFALRQFHPITAMAIRFALVALVLVPWRRLPWAHVRPVLAYSFVLGGLHFPLVFSGLMGCSAAAASVAIQLQVPFASLMAAVFFKDRLGWRRAVGMAAAIAGVGIIAYHPGGADDPAHLGLVVLAAAAFAFSSIQLKWMPPMDPFTLNGYMALFAVPQLVLMSAVLEDGQWAAIQTAPPAAWGSILFMALVSTILAYVLWFPLVQRYAVNQTMPFMLLVPVFGVAGGVILLGEPLSWHLAAGTLVTIAGVGVVLLRRPRLVTARTAS
ncbi:DMT family transporter [Nitrospirillum viridazoti]|uniref:Multidrug DMT transporter permease n=1 Tax=Nitrospirillum viridazoti CBAmc TaxID=1441467 RepID=A0A248JRG5_9PROT|nr:EamA family transporter [Nitrospirillum amazonense]ASG21110.1 multidrug DMT transporter permease [Nitrospirillum amazonense CBAmc]TWB26140.1 O-acetylserine/cysteine efflux transporter [Nitrospirillum amazonense]